MWLKNLKGQMRNSGARERERTFKRLPYLPVQESEPRQQKSPERGTNEIENICHRMYN